MAYTYDQLTAWTKRFLPYFMFSPRDRRARRNTAIRSTPTGGSDTWPTRT